MTNAIGWSGLAVSFLLVLVAAGLSAAQRLGLERSILWAALRAVAQLMLVGVVLTYLLEPDRPLLLAWCWVGLMLVVAADVVRRRVPEVPGVFLLALGAFAAAATVVVGVLFGLGVFDLDARTLITLAGLMIGNCMTATVLVARRITDDLRDKRAEIEARLALGLAPKEAARPTLRDAMRTALIPQIESTKTVGLVALPGAMTGLILAGAEPIDAVQVQAAVMFVVLAATASTATVMARGTQRRLFTPDERLRPLPRTAEPAGR